MNLSQSAYNRMWRHNDDVNSRLIVIDGFDGSGKSTQVSLLDTYLRSKGYQCITACQPSDWYRTNSYVRSYLDRGAASDQLLLAYLSATDRRNQIVNHIDRVTADGIYFVCDRYVYSALAYFAERGLDPNIVAQLNVDIPRPSLTVFLDAPGHCLLDRITRRDGDVTKFEERCLDKIDSIASRFREIAAIDRNIVVIDARRDATEIHRIIVDRLIA